MRTSVATVTAFAGSLLLAPLMLGLAQAGSAPDLKDAVIATHDGAVMLVREVEAVDLARRIDQATAAPPYRQPRPMPSAEQRDVQAALAGALAGMAAWCSPLQLALAMPCCRAPGHSA